MTDAIPEVPTMPPDDPLHRILHPEEPLRRILLRRSKVDELPPEIPTAEPFDRLGALLISRLSAVAVGHIFLMSNFTGLTFVFCLSAAQRVGLLIPGSLLLVILLMMSLMSFGCLLIMIEQYRRAPK